MTPADFTRNMETGTYWITRCIAQGAFPESKQGFEMRKSGVTDIFNVGTVKSVLNVQRTDFSRSQTFPSRTLSDCLTTTFSIVWIDSTRRCRSPAERRTSIASPARIARRPCSGSTCSRAGCSLLKPKR